METGHHHGSPIPEPKAHDPHAHVAHTPSDHSHPHIEHGHDEHGGHAPAGHGHDEHGGGHGHEKDAHHKPEVKAKEKLAFKAAIVNTTSLMEAQARDLADSRMTESKEDRSKNWFTRKLKQIWKHNFMQEWYRQREISRARKEIFDTKNLYAGEPTGADRAKSDEAMNSIIDRFTSEFEQETLGEDERKDLHKGVKSQEINDLIKRYASTGMTDEVFRTERDRIMAKLDPNYESPKPKKNMVMYADNLLKIASEVRGRIAHGENIEAMDIDVELTIGKARDRLKTEAHGNFFDKTIEKGKNSKIGKYVLNVPGAVGLYAGIYSIGKYFGKKTLRSDAAKLATFGGAALVSGSMAAMEERARFERERSQHSREVAKGMIFNEKDMKRRQEMDKTLYETRKSTDIIEKLNADLARVTSGQKIDATAFNAIVANLADIEARIRLNDTKKIDLISYSSYNEVNQEGTAYDLARGRLKKALREAIASKTVTTGTSNTFDSYLAQLTDAQARALMGGESGIEARDKAASKMKTKKAAWAFAKSAMIGAGIGIAVQEIHAAFHEEIDGVVEGIAKHFNEKDLAPHATMLEALRRHMSGDAPHTSVAFGPEHTIPLGGTMIHLPENVTLTENPDHTFNLVHAAPGNNETLAQNLKLEFNPDGSLTDASDATLRAHGILSQFSSETQPGMGEVSVADYLKAHPGSTHHAHFRWMGNDTRMEIDPDTGKLIGADFNELKTDWGGVNGTGVDADGNYVFNISRMTDDGSFQDGVSVEARQAMLAGQIKMAFSVNEINQHEIFEVKFDANGNAIIPKDSEIAKLMFTTNEDGHAVFTGRYAQPVFSRGFLEDGSENVDVLGAHEGDGKDMLVDATGKTTPHVKLDLPRMKGPGGDWDWDTPYFIPAVTPRRPLERGAHPEKAPLGVVEKPHEEEGHALPAANEQKLLGPGTTQTLIASPKEQWSKTTPEAAGKKRNRFEDLMVISGFDEKGQPIYESALLDNTIPGSWQEIPGPLLRRGEFEMNKLEKRTTPLSLKQGEVVQLAVNTDERSLYEIVEASDGHYFVRKIVRGEEKGDSTFFGAHEAKTKPNPDFMVLSAAELAGYLAGAIKTSPTPRTPETPKANPESIFENTVQELPEQEFEDPEKMAALTREALAYTKAGKPVPKELEERIKAVKSGKAIEHYLGLTFIETTKGKFDVYKPGTEKAITKGVKLEFDPTGNPTQESKDLLNEKGIETVNVRVEENKDGTVNLYNTANELIAENMKLEMDNAGNLTPESQEALEAYGLYNAKQEAVPEKKETAPLVAPAKKENSEKKGTVKTLEGKDFQETLSTVLEGMFKRITVEGKLEKSAVEFKNGKIAADLEIKTKTQSGKQERTLRVKLELVNSPTGLALNEKFTIIDEKVAGDEANGNLALRGKMTKTLQEIPRELGNALKKKFGQKTSLPKMEIKNNTLEATWA